jgi:hypothetical protein
MAKTIAAEETVMVADVAQTIVTKHAVMDVMAAMKRRAKTTVAAHHVKMSVALRHHVQRVASKRAMTTVAMADVTVAAVDVTVATKVWTHATSNRLRMANKLTAPLSQTSVVHNKDLVQPAILPLPQTNKTTCNKVQPQALTTTRATSPIQNVSAAVVAAVVAVVVKMMGQALRAMGRNKMHNKTVQTMFQFRRMSRQPRS